MLQHVIIYSFRRLLCFPRKGPNFKRPMTAKALKVPENISLLCLPSYSPELNAPERLWGYLKSHYLGNRAYTDYDDLLETCRDTWNKITMEQFRTVCHSEWIQHEN